MKKQKLGMILAVFVGVLTLFWWNQRLDSHAKTLNVYSNLAALPGFDRKSVEGDYFILHFWAKWCEPCAEEIPHLVEFAEKSKFQKPLKILAVSLDPTLEEAKTILPGGGEHLPPNFILALDPEHKFAEKMGSYQYPETYFIDPKGQIIEKWIGPQKWMKPEVFDFFKAKVL